MPLQSGRIAIAMGKLERKGIWEISETARKAENRARKP